MRAYPDTLAEQDIPEGFEVFVVHVTRAYAEFLLRRVRLMLDVLARDPDAHEIRFWDDEGAWFSVDFDDTPEPQPIGEPGRVELQHLIVRPDRVLWLASPKHAAVRVITDEIRVEEVNHLRLPRRRLAERSNPDVSPR